MQLDPRKHVSGKPGEIHAELAELTCLEIPDTYY